MGIGAYGSTRGSYQPFSSWKFATNMWSVKTLPKARSLSLGFAFFAAVFVILIASLMPDSPLAPAAACAPASDDPAGASAPQRVSLPSELGVEMLRLHGAVG